MTVNNLQTQPTHIVQANGVDLCVQTHGEQGNEPILLIAGAASSMLGWPDSVVEDLAAGSRFVIRYDHRDSGQSVRYPPGAPGYGLYDLVDDAVGLLDALGLPEAHVVGISMGGGVAQVMALNYPERVTSVTLMATSPGGPDLSPMSNDFIDFVTGAREPDWSDESKIVNHILSMMRVFAGHSGPIDDARLRAMLVADLERSTANPRSCQVNHFAIDPGEPVRERLGNIAAPTLVIHGDRDPIFELDHAEAMLREIPDARLLVLEGVGHMIPWQASDRVVPAILEHTNRKVSKGDQR